MADTTENVSIEHLSKVLAMYQERTAAHARWAASLAASPEAEDAADRLAEMLRNLRTIRDAHQERSAASFEDTPHH